MFLLQAYKGLNDFYRYLIVIILVILGYIVGQIPFTIAVMNTPAFQDQVDDVKAGSTALNLSQFGLDQNLTLFLLLLMFVVAMIALFFGVTRIHKRTFLSIFTARKSFSFSRFFWGFFIWMLFSMMLEFWAYSSDPTNYTWHFDPVPFLLLVLICVTLLPIQTTFEEVFFRGYLLQALGFLFRSRIGALLLTSLFFGLMHMMNPEVTAFGWTTMLTYYVTIAIFLGTLALVDEGLELSIGVHTATNIYGAMFVTFDESALQTPALFRMTEVDPSALTIYSITACILFLLISHWKYKFNWHLITGPYIPTSWHHSYQDSVDEKIEPIAPEEIDVSHIEKIQRGDFTFLQSTRLIQPQTFFKSSRLIDFEIAAPIIDHPTQDFVVPLSEDKAENLVQKLQQSAGSDIVSNSNKLQVTLDNGEEVNVILARKPFLIRPKFENLNWEMKTLFAIPVTSIFYQNFQLTDYPKLDSIIH